jgi:AcrR family transcriptional regulator
MAPSAAAQTETKAGPRTRRGRYISESIMERRRRMLEVAKAMIADGGSEGFTIRELGRRAKVSVTTIYATYGDKEGLIAAAIQDYFDGLPLARARPTTSLPALLAGTDLARDAILANKAYARQYAELFFSGTVDARIYKAIQDTATASNGRMPWLQKVMREGDLIPGVELGYVVATLANQGLMVLHDWAQGRIKDEDLATAIKMGFLTLARGVTRGPTQARVESELKKLLRSAGSASSE